MALYGYSKALFCERHSPSDATNLIEHTCASCGLTEVLNGEGLCGSCDPTAMRKRVHLGKQKLVR